ncbi:hypothetical protein JCM3770_000004 [Rhodotorula araucariae]
MPLSHWGVRNINNYLREHGIERETRRPYSPQSNGVAERVNRSIVEGIISLLNQAGAPKDLWAEGLQAFVFVKNRSPHATLLGKVPLATWQGAVFPPTNAEGSLRLLTRFSGLSLPAASPEAFDAVAKDYRATLAALRVAKVDLDTIYSSHLLAALPSSLAARQTTIAVANQSTLPKPDAILNIVRNEVLRTAPVGGSIALAPGAANLPPSTPCPACKANHWLRVCLKRDEYRAARRGSRKAASAQVTTAAAPRPSPLAPSPPSLTTNQNGFKVTGFGTLFLRLASGCVVKLNSALLVPGISTTLISLAQLYDLHVGSSTFVKHATLARNNVVLAKGSRVERGLYRLNGELVNLSPSVAGVLALLAASTSQAKLTTWHQSLAHLAPRSLKSLAKSGDMTGLDIVAEQADGIARETPPPYSPQSNGVAECVNRSIVEGIISLLNQAGAPKDLWAEALQAFVSVKNRSPHAALLGKVLLATWQSRPVCVDMLRVWGCRAWHTATHGRSKLDDTAVPLVFIRYDGTAAYRFLHPASRKIVRSRDARFVEHEFPLRESPAPSPGPLAPFRLRQLARGASSFSKHLLLRVRTSSALPHLRRRPTRLT